MFKLSSKQKVQTFCQSGHHMSQQIGKTEFGLFDLNLVDLN